MEGTNTLSGSGVTVVGSDAPSTYHVAPRPTNENPSRPTGSESLAVTISPAPVSFTPSPSDAAAGVGSLSALKKKRGRPRKYAPDGSVSKPLSPKPISSSAPPPVIDFSVVSKRGKFRPVVLPSKPRTENENMGDQWSSGSVGANFMAHIVKVDAGEDVMKKVISFSQQGPRAICVLSANGIVSSATLRQPDSSGGTLTYEGRFEILSLTGSFMPAETGGLRNRSGGMSVSLASPDGRVVGGGVAGLLVAASPVQIVIGSFLATNQHEPNTKKLKAESMSMVPASSISIPITSVGVDDARHSWSSAAPTDVNTTLPG